MTMDTPPVMAVENIGALFLGFTAGTILFGVALLQTYQYFMTYAKDAKHRKVLIVIVLMLNTLHLMFSTIMMYFFVSRPQDFMDDSYLWTLKGFATTKVLQMVLVQSYYLSIIWQFAKRLLLRSFVSNVIQSVSVILFIYAIVMAIAFLIYFEQDGRFSNFSVSFQNIFYVAWGSTVVVDSMIAGILSVLLHRTSPARQARSGNVITFLVLFFIGTGLLTAIMAIITIVVYVAWSSTLLYLAIEFIVPRLYANSILALFNSKARLQKRMEGTAELQLSSMVLFSHNARRDPASTEEENP